MKRYLLRYSTEASDRPVLAEAVLKTGVLVNILTADVEYSKEMLAIGVLGGPEAERKLIDYLGRHGVEAEELSGNILKDEERCVDCLACYGVCPTKAITIRDWRMRLDNDECIRCGQCVEACPTRALSLPKA